MTFAQFFFENPIPCWIYDTQDFTFMAVNKSACQRYGYTEEEMVEKMTIFDIRPAEDFSLILKTIHEGCNTDRRVFRHIARSGPPFKVEVSSFATKLNGRHCRYVMAFNIEERIRIESENIELRNKINSISNSFPMG